jgi:hypothetical protein
MEWLTVTLGTMRFTMPKRHPDHKVVTIESIITKCWQQDSPRLTRAALVHRV